MNKELIKEQLEINKSVDPDTNCWNWYGSRSKGYGELYYGSKRRVGLVHRLSMFVYKDFDLDSELGVLHKCDNKKCWNPDHLYVGTQKDNIRDASARKRLRGQRKTHCPQGHEYSEENTYIYPRTNHRQCIKCQRETQRRIRSNNK